MANKILITEREQYLHTDMVAFSGNVGFGFSTTLSGEISGSQLPLTLNIEGVDAISIPAGTTLERPVSGERPMFRYNNELMEFELYSPDTDIWSIISDNIDISTLSAQVQSNTSRIEALEYVDINISSLGVSPASIFEFNVTPQPLVFTWAINRDPTTNEVRSKSNPIAVLPNTATGSYNIDFNITETTGDEVAEWWTEYVTDVSGDLNSSDTYTRNVYWVYPYYYGVSVADIGTIDVSNLYKDISRRSSKTLPVNATDEFIYYVYPATYPDLSSILDGNGFDVTSSFTKYTGPITGASGSPISYKIYKTNSITTVDQDFKFII